MSLHDISVVTGAGTPEWPGDAPFTCGWTARIEDGSSVNLSVIRGSPHVGTHADAPLHVIDNAASADMLPLGAFIGPALVVAVSGAPRDLGTELLDRVPDGTARLLLRTGASIASGTFPADWPAITPQVAERLVARGLRLLGVDAPSVDRRNSKSLLVHHALFEAGACVLENLQLEGILDGQYELVAAPVRWAGADAAPVRAVLRPASAR